ncbi:MAG: hypothetical protein L0I76_12330 [Pseudonocardia sp.]|nr:hypothetical protein [Pseudonocardia sp.]
MSLFLDGRAHGGGVASHDELIAHLVRSTPLSPGEAARVVADVLGYFAEPAGDFVRRRHGELQARGLRNEQIFDQVAAELARRRVPAPEYSARQLRRLVYG